MDSQSSQYILDWTASDLSTLIDPSDDQIEEIQANPNYEDFDHFAPGVFRQNQYARDPRQNYPNPRRWNNEGNSMGNRVMSFGKPTEYPEGNFRKANPQQGSFMPMPPITGEGPAQRTIKRTIPDSINTVPANQLSDLTKQDCN